MYRTTIGIPTYNRATLLERAISSALNQGPHVCVVVSDNASTDHTAEVVQRFRGYGDRLQYIRQPENKGATNNFLTLLLAARTKYFMWLGDDDWLDAHYETSCVKILESHGGYALVSGIARYYSDSCTQPTGEDVLMALEQDDRSQRVCSYYSLVRENGVFYGIAETSLWASVGVQSSFGFDWTMCAYAAFHGKVLTLQNIHIHRVVGGASTPAGLVKLHRLRGLARRPEFHELILAWTIFRDIGVRRHVGAELPLLSRLALAFRAAASFLYSRYGSIYRLPSRLRMAVLLAVTAREESAAAQRQLHLSNDRASPELSGRRA